MSDPSVVEVPISSLPYCLRCQRCVQRRLHLRHNPPPWLVANPRVRSRRDWLKLIRGRELGALGADFPVGILSAKGAGVRSRAIQVPGHERHVILTGRMAIFATVDDLVSSVVYVDPPPPRLDAVAFRTPQLHAYRYAIENPSNPTTVRGHVGDVRAGVLAISVGATLLSPNSSPWIQPESSWLEAKWTDDQLLLALARILDVYDVDPSIRLRAGDDCSWCNGESQAA